MIELTQGEWPVKGVRWSVFVSLRTFRERLPRFFIPVFHCCDRCGNTMMAHDDTPCQVKREPDTLTLDLYCDRCAEHACQNS